MTRKESRLYAPVLEHMIDLLGSNGRLTFGDALKLAMAKHGHETIPQHVEAALLTASYKIIMNRGLPGAADA